MRRLAILGQFRPVAAGLHAIGKTAQLLAKSAAHRRHAKQILGWVRHPSNGFMRRIPPAATAWDRRPNLGSLPGGSRAVTLGAFRVYTQ